MMAVKEGHEEIAKLLIQYGADIKKNKKH